MRWAWARLEAYMAAMTISKRAPFVLTAASLTLAACGDGSSTSGVDGVAEADRIECALAGSTKFERACATETMPGDKGKLLVVRHPDGGFSRFNILTDGRGLAPADGFDETSINILGGGMIEVRSGDDIYRLPADIKSPGQK